MQFRNRNTIIASAFILLVVAAGTAAGVPYWKAQTAKSNELPPLPEPERVSENDMRILEELGGVLKKIDSLNAFETAGSIRVSDPDEGEQSLEYHYAKRDSLSYYKLGQQETLSNGKIVVMADHYAEKLFVTPAGQTPKAGFMPAGDQLAAFLTGEGYAIRKSETDGMRYIELTRPNHINYKVYRIGYDDAGLVRESFIRMTDISHPLDTSRDRIIRTSADRWIVGRPPTDLFDIYRLIKEEGGSYVPMPAYQHYDIILTQ
ncbi:hypothetical protein [Chitinophaga deserti]|uniref:hypothetical protein n=1 Tax=Chitinophaga deserti TaxID=2164099 RepID=UPI0013004E78|nr:hypothetical protein [Chitinophaga deserti]